MFRRKRFWRLRDLDLDEPLIQDLEERYRSKTAGVDEYANFAACVTTWSGEGLMQRDPVSFQAHRAVNLIFSNDYLLRFPKKIFRESMPILFAFGLLSSPEYNQLVSNRGYVHASASNHALPTSGIWSHYSLYQAPFFRAQLVGICIDMDLEPWDKDPSASLLISVGYSYSDLLEAQKLQSHGSVFLARLFLFGCDNAEFIPTASSRVPLTSHLDLWAGMNFENRVRFPVVIPPDDSKLQTPLEAPKQTTRPGIAPPYVYL